VPQFWMVIVSLGLLLFLAGILKGDFESARKTLASRTVNKRPYIISTAAMWCLIIGLFVWIDVAFILVMAKY
jgi:hypothetical protein